LASNTLSLEGEERLRYARFVYPSRVKTQSSEAYKCWHRAGFTCDEDLELKTGFDHFGGFDCNRSVIASVRFSFAFLQVNK